MNLRGICWVFLFSMFIGIGKAQRASGVRIDRSMLENTSTNRSTTDFAGTVEMTEFDGQSNDAVFPGPIYLCFLDQFQITHNGDEVFCPDNDPLTLPGIGYAFYDCQPLSAAQGPQVNSILNDPCITLDPPPFADPGFWVYTDQRNGDATFWNDGYIQDQFGNPSGTPRSMWFAPLTFDNFGNNTVIEAGGQVNVNTNEAFEVVYLNAVEISNKMTGVGGNPLAGSFQVSGGISELDGTNYSNVRIWQEGSFESIDLADSNFQHGDVINFTVPEVGVYNIYVEDEKSCSATMEISFLEEVDDVIINIGDVSGERGDSDCTSFCVEGFDDVLLMTFTIVFDPNIITFDSIHNFGLTFLSDGSIGDLSQDEGLISVSWFDQLPADGGITLNDGDCLFDLCFTFVDDASQGDCSLVGLNSNLVETEIGFHDPSGAEDVIISELDFVAGNICVTPSSDLNVEYNSCSASAGTFEGSLDFRIYGGSGTYSYLFIGFDDVTDTGISEGQLVSISNLAPSPSYVLQITDTNTGESITETIEILEGDPLMVDLTSVDPTCFGGENGTLTANVTGGTAFSDPTMPYMYEWSNGFFNIESFPRIESGSYSVTVTDANGCTASANENIWTSPINAEIEIVSLPSCVEATDGVVNVTLSGGPADGTNDYLTIWQGASPNSEILPGQSITNTSVSGGLNSLEITSGVCSWTELIEIEALKELEAEFQFDPEAICAGVDDITLSINGFFSDGQDFRLDDVTVTPTVQGIKTPSSYIINNIVADTYEFSMTDQNTGCRFDTMFTIVEPELLVVNSTANYPCTSTTGGTISLDPTGGAPGYTYLWNDGETDEDRVDLPEGMYSVTVTDMLGCEDVTDFELVRSASATIEGIIVENIGCEGNTTGSLEAVVDANGGTVTYNWDGPGGPYTTPKIENLGPGTYILTITDMLGCVDTEEREILEGVDFTYSIIPTAPTCTNSPDGTLVISVDEPGDYTYEWDHPNNNGTEVLTNITAGEYFVTVTQVGGCAQFDTLTLDAPGGIDIQIQSTSQTLCSYSNDGNATVIASGGVVDDGNYGFFWSSGEEDPLSANTTSTATMLNSGEQFVVVVDALCFDTLFFNIDAPDSLILDEANVSITDISCFGANDGAATLAATGGNGGYLYFWPDEMVDNASITGLGPGFQRYVLADMNGCITLDSIEIQEPDSLIVEIDPVNTLPLGCSNDEDGVIAVTVTGGDISNPYMYEWSDGVSTSSVANALGPGEYDITVTDANGCIDSTTYTIMAPLPISAEVPTPADPVCFGDRTCIGIENVVGGSGTGYRFSINSGELNDIDSCVAVFAGVYDIAIFDNTGCSFDTTLTIEQPDELILNLGPDIQVDLGDSSTIVDISIEGPNPIDSIVWEPNTDFGCLNDDCSRIAIFPNVTTLYNVRVVDDQGCIAEDELLVEVVKIIRAFFPNAFSPNGDGFNDIFNAFTGRGIQSIDEFRVYDRWGNEMYAIRNLPPNNGGTEGWDGRYNGSDVDPGVYSYYAKVTLIDNEQVLLRGDVTLLR